MMQVKVNYPNMPRGAEVFNEALGVLKNGETTEVADNQVQYGIDNFHVSFDDVHEGVLVLGDPDAELYDLPETVEEQIEAANAPVVHEQGPVVPVELPQPPEPVGGEV